MFQLGDCMQGTLGLLLPITCFFLLLLLLLLFIPIRLLPGAPRAPYIGGSYNQL